MSEKKQQIIQTAFRLFSENGFYATGIDQIIAESQTSKKTLYSHFPSKKNLVLAVLRHYEETFIEELRRKTQAKQAEPAEQLLRLFETAQRWYRARKFNGCLAISAMNEFGNKDKSIAKACVSFKRAERALIMDILEAMQVTDSDQVADELLIVLEGIGATAHIGSIRPSMDDIRRLVDKLCC